MVPEYIPTLENIARQKILNSSTDLSSLEKNRKIPEQIRELIVLPDKWVKPIMAKTSKSGREYSSLGRVEKKDKKISYQLLDVFACGQISSPRLYRLSVSPQMIIKRVPHAFLELTTLY